MHDREAAAAIVLAAGRGARMGGPKALLRVDGEPLVLLHARRLRRLASRVVVVLPPSIDGAAMAWPSGVTTVISHAADPAGSLAMGVTHVAESHPLVIIAHVDALPVREATVRVLLDAMAPHVDAATPTYRGAGGHPVVLRRALLAVVAPSAQPTTLRDRLTALGSRRVRIACDDDPAVVSSLNTPRDLHALRARGIEVSVTPSATASRG